MEITIIILSILLIITYKFRQKFITNKSFYLIPSGPKALPFLGNLLQIVKNPHLKLSQWAYHYGKLFTIYLGNKQALVINDPKLMKELFSQFPATGKFATDTMLLISQGPYGMLNTEGQDWHEQKQFFIKTVVKFGFGGSTLEQLIISEIDQVFEWIENQNGAPITLNDILKHASNNTLWTIVSGERVSLENRKIVNLLDNFLDGMQLTLRTGLGFFPWLKYIAPGLSGYLQFDKACKDLHNFVREQFEEHKKVISEGSPRDVIDAYIDHVENTTKRGKVQSPFYGEVGYINSISAVVEMFTGAGDTTSATMNWMLYYLSFYPEVQKDLMREIDQLIGQERDPCLADKSRVPIVEAVVLETLRYSTLVPLGIIHRLTEDIVFKEFKLPKGLLLIPNIYHCHHSTDIWGDPENFRPNRFLENETLKEYVISFQPGKRSCPGEPLARDVLFLFVTKFFQRWQVGPLPGISKEEYFSPEVGVLLLPKKLEVVITKRNIS